MSEAIEMTNLIDEMLEFLRSRMGYKDEWEFAEDDAKYIAKDDVCVRLYISNRIYFNSVEITDRLSNRQKELIGDILYWMGPNMDEIKWKNERILKENIKKFLGK